jgi:hypothetical protein
LGNGFDPGKKTEDSQDEADLIPWLADPEVEDRPVGYGWVDNVVLAEFTNWQFTPWLRVGYVKPWVRPKGNVAETLISLLLWLGELIISVANKGSVNEIPILWWQRILMLQSARAQAEPIRQDIARQKAEARRRD